MQTPLISAHKLVILDRDGVINEDSDDYIKSSEEWHPIVGSLEAIARLKQKGYQVAIATNQSGIARGYYNEACLHAMHDKMAALLNHWQVSIDFITYCPHLAEQHCACRKPKAGMIWQIAEHFSLTPDSLKHAVFIGDTLKDYGAAKAAKMPFVLVKTGKGQRTLNDPHLPPDLIIYDNLAAYVDDLLEGQ
ncbi:MAG: D-glycero-beta-D-manno-heptose 1,7-bisphosphate 7-phosphatase [bacterium]